jgi:hypothetical protein
MSQNTAHTLVPAGRPSLLLSLLLCLVLWGVRLLAEDGLKPDFTGSLKDVFLLLIAAVQAFLLVTVLWRWVSKGPGDKLLAQTTIALLVSGALWFVDSGI